MERTAMDGFTALVNLACITILHLYKFQLKTCVRCAILVYSEVWKIDVGKFHLFSEVMYDMLAI